MDIDTRTSIDQLHGDQRELADVIGIEAYKKLVSQYAGSILYIQKLDSVLKDIRDREIKEKFDGANYRNLAREYSLAESTVRDIVADRRRTLRPDPDEGQMRFE
jgi:Mor family transcriptional regulator